LTFKRVIVGIDGSRASSIAKEYAFIIGKHFDIPVVGMHIVDVRLLNESFLEDLAGALGFTYYLGISQRVREFLEERANALIEGFLSEGRQKGVKVSSFQTVGVPHEELVSQADPYDLLVVGRKGQRPVKGFFLSSTADTVSRRSKCPVLLVPEEERSIKNLLVAYDGREVSKKALSVGRVVANAFGASIKALYVGEEEIEAPQDLELVRLYGLPEEKIVSYCRQEGVDMLLMGAYSKGRLREFFMGSVTSFVVHHLDIPILLVK